MPAGMMVDGDKTERAATGVLTTAAPSTAGRLGDSPPLLDCLKLCQETEKLV